MDRFLGRSNIRQPPTHGRDDSKGRGNPESLRHVEFLFVLSFKCYHDAVQLTYNNLFQTSILPAWLRRRIATTETLSSRSAAKIFKDRDSPESADRRTSRPSFQAENRTRWPIGEFLLWFLAILAPRGGAECQSGAAISIHGG
jgi:hypothetical protein